MAASIEDIAGHFGLGPIDQISFAVTDVREAAERYATLFGGAFHVIDAEMPEITYRGKPSSVHLRLGFGRTGPIEVELVQVVSGDCPITEHLAEHGEGFHHVRFPVDDLDAVQAAMEAEGYVPTFEGGSAGVKFAYLESPALGGKHIELIQMPSA